MIISLSGDEFNGENAFCFDGDLYVIGKPVYLWDHKQGYDGYTVKKVKIKNNRTINGPRYATRAPTTQDSIDKITQLLIHHSGGDRANPGVMYDVLYNQRGLSVQFATEDDGRIWQFNDAIDKCRHAGGHNGISIGNECCLFPLVNQNPNYYSEKRNKKTGNLPHDIMIDVIHGNKMKVFEFTAPQVDSLAWLYAGLWFAIGVRRTTKLEYFDKAPKFPRIDGNIAKTVIQNPKNHVGLIGHLHTTTRKIDPVGFPWEDFENQVEINFNEILQNNNIK